MANEGIADLHLHTVYSDGGHFNSVGNLIIAAEVIGALGVKLPG